MNPIPPISSIPGVGSTQPVGGVSPASKAGAKPVDEGGFSKLLNQFVQETNQAQAASDQSISDLVEGKTDNIQQVVMAVANAEMSFQLFMEIRNKFVESYNDLMRMQF